MRNVFMGLFMMFALLAINSIYKDEYLLYYSAIGLILFLALRLSCVWVFEDVKHPFFALAQWVFLIPGSLAIAYYSYKMSFELNSKGLILVALSFAMYVVLLPIYMPTSREPLAWALGI